LWAVRTRMAWRPARPARRVGRPAPAGRTASAPPRRPARPRGARATRPARRTPGSTRSAPHGHGRPPAGGRAPTASRRAPAPVGEELQPLLADDGGIAEREARPPATHPDGGEVEYPVVGAEPGLVEQVARPARVERRHAPTGSFAAATGGALGTCAVMWVAMCSASLLTPWIIAEDMAYRKCRPTRYRPGWPSTTPRWWAGSSSPTPGRSIHEKSCETRWTRRRWPPGARDRPRAPAACP
jgi:hypothetical protein